MAEFRCSNEDCSYELRVAKVKYRSMRGNLVPDVHADCPDCGSPLVQEVPDADASKINIGTTHFENMGPAEKREALKKRAKRHFALHSKKEVDEKRESTIREMRQKFEEGTRL